MKHGKQSKGERTKELKKKHEQRLRRKKQVAEKRELAKRNESLQMDKIRKMVLNKNNVVVEKSGMPMVKKGGMVSRVKQIFSRKTA